MDGTSRAQKQRLQQVLFPEGLRFDGDEFGTAVTCLAFTKLDETAAPARSVDLISPEGASRTPRLVNCRG